MPELLSPGRIVTITEDVSYALPASKCMIQASAVCELSLDNSTFVSVAATTTGVETVAGFVRCTTGNAVISVKKV